MSESIAYLGMLLILGAFVFETKDMLDSKNWIYLTPFPYLIDFPANLLSENTTNISGGLSMQILWILLMYPLFRKIWYEGTKKYTAMGS